MAGDLSTLRQRPAVFSGSAGRMFLKAAQFSQQSPPRVQVHHLKNMSRLFWRRAWEPKFVPDPGPPAGSITNRCPATRMDKVIFHSLCCSKIEQELYLKQESNTMYFRNLTAKKALCFINYKDKRVRTMWSLTTKNTLLLQILPLQVLWLSLTLHAHQEAWLFLQITNIFPCNLQNGFGQNVRSHTSCCMG